MQYAKEVKYHEGLTQDNVDASGVHGKLRVASFDVKATGTDTQAVLAYLPAGRGRVLPQLSYFTTSGITTACTIGNGAYTKAEASGGTQAADADSISTSITCANSTVKQFTGVVQWEYISAEDVPVIFTGTLAASNTIKGYLVYVVE